MKNNKLIFIITLLLMKYSQCVDWPPDYIEETPTIIKESHTIIEQIQINIKFRKKLTTCSWHNENENEIYCKNDLKWNISSGHCF